MLILVSKAFSGGFDRVLGALGFLLPPCAFCGLPILLCGKTKGWDGDVGGVRFSEIFFGVKVVGPGALFFTIGILPCRFRFSPSLKNVCEQGSYFI